MARSPEEFTVGSIRFLGEQDGVPERELKARLCNAFAQMNIRCRAYLVRADYGAPDTFNVALCVRTELTESTAVKVTVNRAFSEMFRTEEHLDLVFLSDDQEREVQAVARPFLSSLASPTL